MPAGASAGGEGVTVEPKVTAEPAHGGMAKDLTKVAGLTSFSISFSLERAITRCDDAKLGACQVFGQSRTTSLRYLGKATCDSDQAGRPRRAVGAMGQICKLLRLS